MLDPLRFFSNFADVEIDRPIFLLGTKGGGLTLVSRILRRNPSVVSVSGNYKYWSGADEMHIVLGPVLPSTLTGVKHQTEADKVFATPEGWRDLGWLYATDQLLPNYRNTAGDATSEIETRFKKILRWIIKRHSLESNSARFTDKSQIYTVKVSFVAALLAGCSPHFILITRNPYALCYRSVSKTRALGRLKGHFDFNQRLEFAAQHWANSMECALEDGVKQSFFKVLRFEDVLGNPTREIKAICDFGGLDFNPDMLPQPEHQVPFGSLRRDRWYPLRPEVNEKYLQEMTSKHVEIVARYCESLANELGYVKPKK